MEHARGECDDHEEEKADAGTQGATDGGVETGLASSTHQRKEASDHIKLCRLAAECKRSDFTHHSMCRDIQPASDRVDRGVLPRLKPVSMIEIMCRLPEVEDFITVLNWCVESCNHIGDDAKVECDIQW